MMTKTSALAVVLMSIVGPVAHADTGDDQDAPLVTHARVDAPGPAGMDGSGKTSLDLRYRYEYVNDDAATYAGQASTLRAALGYATRSFHGFSAMGQLAAVGALGPDFYRVPTSPTQNNMAYPTVLDPTGLAVAQAYVRYDASWLTVKLGRQELAFNNTRFLSATPWRQVHQTFGAASVVVKPTEGVSIQYALTGRVNRVTGPNASDGQLYLLGHLINATYKRRGLGSLAVYDLRLDYLADSASSTNTLGARVEGPLQLDEDWSVLYAAELAHQTDAANNPNPFAANYYLAEAGAAFRGISGRVQYNVRDGSGPMAKLSTPLSRPGDGWSEKFEITPDAGLRTLAVSFAGAVPMVRGLSASTAHYEYWSQSTGAHYGREQDVGLEYRLVGVDRHWTAGSHVSFYKADKLFADTLRMSPWDAVASDISSDARVFAYSRPGYGKSAAATTPRDPATIVEELRALLRHQGYAPPYILVGHSFGGTYMELFAKAHPGEVTGVVLVEPRHRDFLARCEAAHLDMCGISASDLATLFDVQIAEYDAFPMAAAEIAAAGTFGSYPVRVLTATGGSGSAARNALWEATHASLAAEATDGRQTLFAGASHNLETERASEVAASIRALLPASGAAGAQ